MKEIKTIGIIGFNVMGAAIGLNIAASGYRVIYKELNDELVQSMYDKWVVKALNGVSVVVNQGETYGLVGESGCGKSVTMFSVMRLIDQPGDEGCFIDIAVVTGSNFGKGLNTYGKFLRSGKRLLSYPALPLIAHENSSPL